MFSLFCDSPIKVVILPKPTPPPTKSPVFVSSSEPSAGPTPPSASLQKYYVHWTLFKCVQDCDGPPPCGGKWEAWRGQQYSTAGECCVRNLPFLSLEQCKFAAQPNGQPSSKPTFLPSPLPSVHLTLKPTAKPSSAFKYYVDWSNLKCVQDCDGPPPCGGKWVSWKGRRYNTVEECCLKNLPFQSIDNCQLAPGSYPTLKPTPFGKSWYANYSSMQCVQDCNGASPCGGYRKSWQKLFDTFEDCCHANKVFEKCKGSQTSGIDLFD